MMCDIVGVEIGNWNVRDLKLSSVAINRIETVNPDLACIGLLSPRISQSWSGCKQNFPVISVAFPCSWLIPLFFFISITLSHLLNFLVLLMQR